MAFPIISKRQMQMTCSTTDDRLSMPNEGTPRNEDNRFPSSDIVKQVETWMKNQRLSEQYAPRTHRSQPSPTQPTERSRKRRKRISGQSKFDQSRELSDATNYIGTADSEIVSTAESKSLHKKLYEQRERKFPVGNVFKPPQATKLNYGFQREPVYKNYEKHNQNTRFGSIHDEIEFQKRYKRISDLQTHLRFVNESYLSGKNILTEKKTLAPVSTRRPQKLVTSDMFEISPVEKQEKQTYTKHSKKKNVFDSTPRSHRNFKKKPFSWQKFQKLPNITPDSNTPKKALSESDVRFVDDDNREEGKPGYASSARLSKEDANDERSRSVVTTSSYGPYQEMKVTIHIRYKKPRATPTSDSDLESRSENSSDKSFVEDTPNAYDGRIHAQYQSEKISQPNKQSVLSRNENTLASSPLLRNLSRTSNISKKNREHFVKLDDVTIPSLSVNETISNTPTLTAGKI